MNQKLPEVLKSAPEKTQNPGQAVAQPTQADEAVLRDPLQRPQPRGEGHPADIPGERRTGQWRPLRRQDAFKQLHSSFVRRVCSGLRAKAPAWGVACHRDVGAASTCTCTLSAFDCNACRHRKAVFKRKVLTPTVFAISSGRANAIPDTIVVMVYVPMPIYIGKSFCATVMDFGASFCCACCRLLHILSSAVAVGLIRLVRFTTPLLLEVFMVYVRLAVRCELI
eukprot:scaffold65084_cov32-Prasinocladus_malaysianus.AAC.1